MQATQISAKALDTILAHQFIIAWAGEGLCDPPRLKWWRTDLVDEYGGGDLMQRLAPRTHKWAALEAARQAALLADSKARHQMANPDKVRTLFFWGFEVDELLQERLRILKWDLREPAKALTLPLALSADFRLEQFESVLQECAPEAPFTVQLSGRELKQEFPQDLIQASHLLMRAMLPISNEYPAPFFRIP